MRFQFIHVKCHRSGNSIERVNRVLLYLQITLGLRRQGISFLGGFDCIGKQQLSVQSSAQPQSHSSPGSTTSLPQIDS